MFKRKMWVFSGSFLTGKQVPFHFWCDLYDYMNKKIRKNILKQTCASSFQRQKLIEKKLNLICVRKLR